MKKSTVLLFLLSLVIFIGFRCNYAFAVDNDYYIKNLNIDVTVNDKKQCIVKERVNVHFNKNVDKFYKTINTELDGEYVNVSRVKVIGEKFSFINDLYDNSIVIGDGKTGFSGDKVFFIEYTVDYYKRKDNKNDILSFDALQDTYDGDIKNYYEKITMPCKIEPKNITVSSGKYNSEGENELNIKTRISGNSIELSKNSSIERGSKIKLKADFNEGTFKEIPDFKYNYVIKDKDVDIHITRQQEYYVTQKYLIDVIDENAEDNNLRLLSIGSSLDKIYDFKCSSKAVSISSYYDMVELPKKKGLVEFTVSYKQKPSLDSKIVFSVYSGSKYVNIEKMKFCVSSAVPIKDCKIDGDDEIKSRINLKKDEYNITLENSNYLNKNGLLDLDVEADKSKFTRPMKMSGLIKFLAAFVCFVVSLFSYKKYCSGGETLSVQKRYYVPEFMDSLKAGYIYNGEISKKNITTLIFYWCSHKHISIKSFRNSEGYNFRITKLNHLDDNHSDYEIKMFDKFFADGSEVIINKRNGGHIMTKMLQHIKQDFIKDIEENHLVSEKPAILRFIINFFMYLSYVFMVYDRVNESRDIVVEFIIFFTIGVLVLLFYGYIMKKCCIVYKSRNNTKGAELFGEILVSTPLFFIICFMFIYKTSPFIITFMTVLFLFVSIYIKNCPLKGNVIYSEKSAYLYGLTKFLEENETAELRMLFINDHEYYFKMFPFAIALGRERNFMSRVKKLSEKEIDEEKIYDFYILNCIFNNRNIML